MDIWQQTNWYVIHTKAYREHLAFASIASLDVEVFLPKIKKEQMVGGFWRVMTKPLFPGYCFARFCPLLFLDTIRCTQGVLRVLGAREFPIPVCEAVIVEIQQRLSPDGFINLRSKCFSPGDRVTIEQGLLAGWVGRVEREWDDNKRVTILLEAIQQARVLIEKRALARVEQSA